MAKQLIAGCPGASPFPQCRGERLDAVEDVGDPCFVMRKYQALGEYVCDELQSFRRLLVQYDVAGRVDLLVDVGPNQ